MRKRGFKKGLAGFLACLTLAMAVFMSYTPITSQAVNFTGRNIWSGGNEIIFGKERSYLFRWTGNGQNTFCIQPGLKMSSQVTSSITHYNINDANIPYISSADDFQRLALICDWYQNEAARTTMASNASYAAAQVAVWAVMDGQWESATSMASLVNAHVSGTSNKMNELSAYVETAYSGADGLPGWVSTNETMAAQNPQNMTLVDGSYRLTLDMSSRPELAQVSWELPTGFSQSVSGSMLVFTYNGTEVPSAEIKGKVPASMASIMKNSENLTIYVPTNTDKEQGMISAGLEVNPGELFIKIGGAKQIITGDSPTVEIFRHKETFESNYHIDLQKYDAETGQDLEGATFDVSEAFDSSQLGDGSDGTVSERNMSPNPTTWNGFRVVGQMLTDEDGHAEFSRRKFYSYNKTYCDGHPEPDYLTVPDEEENELGDVTNQDEIDAVLAENERLRAEWEALITLCKAETDFHDIAEGVAQRMMVDDRDETYQTFINLIYRYTVTETVARSGYIIHGNHNDDVEIEVIATDASEAGANGRTVAESTSFSPPIPMKDDGRLVGLYEAWNPGNIRTDIQDAEEVELSDRREVKETAGIATNSNATSSNASEDTIKEWLRSVGYAYTLYPLKSIKSKPPVVATGSNAKPDKEERQGIFTRLLKRLETAFDMPPSVTVTLPEPELDNVASVTPGSSGKLSYTFHVEDHRTEGEIHINKRDLELFQEDEEDAYGQTQGDATLQGAVYGLFASGDIIHPDGKTGTVYTAGDLVAMAATDENGDASFLVFTEESDTSLATANRAGTWIGHPLILGSYYIQELSRSEGYELSVTGINLSESNRTGGDAAVFIQAGEVSATGLSHRIDDQDGSWNDTTVSYYKTENGFDVIISGYPENSEVFEVTITERTETNRVVIDSQLVPQTDSQGNPVYQLAKGGELKLDASGNPIELGGDDTDNPLTETWYTYYRAGGYPSGTAEPQIDPSKWANTSIVDTAYLQEEVNDMLSQLGYRVIDEADGDGAPWINLQLIGTTHESIGTELMDWFADNNFWNAGAIESITYNGSNYEARLFYDYQGQSGSAFYDSLNGVMYIKKSVVVSGGASESYAWIAYPSGSYSIGGFFATVQPKMEYEGIIPFGLDMEDYLVTKYQPIYDRYDAGEELLDLDGNPVPVMVWKHTYGDVTEVVKEETLTALPAVYDPVAGTYTIHVDNIIDWTNITERQKVTYRVQAPETSIMVDGVEMDYSDYLVQVVGAGVSVIASREELKEGSYVAFQDLLYPGQVQVYQDGGTRGEPVQVLQRAIKQSIKVTKDISQESYEKHNTYKIHRDPFTVLFGGYVGAGKKYIADFHFKAYLVSDLVDAGLLAVGDDGTYDYKQLFHDEGRRAEFDQYAVAWDRPDKDLDGDLTTLHASEGNGGEPYYGRSIMLPYGTYVIVEQVPRNLVNKHYELDDPREVTLPYVPYVDSDGTVHEDVASPDYLYFSSDTPEELQEKFLIRFNEETHIIKAHGHDGDFEVYKYGLKQDLLPNPYGNTVIGERYRYGESENAGSADGVYYQLLYDQAGQVIDYGVTLNGVDTMVGKSIAINGKYAAALVPWSIVDPRYDEVINDNGDIGNREPGLEDGTFNFVGFKNTHFENTFYSSKLRVEKLDAHTGENIIHEGAIFKLYAVSRDVVGDGANNVTGTGWPLFETATVTGTRPELEARGDVDNITWDEVNQHYTGTVTRPVYDEEEQIYMLNEMGEETGIFKAFSTEHSVLKADGSIAKEKTGYIETYQPLGAGTYVLVEVQAPEGYQKSKPIAFEIYKDEAAYYPEGDSGNRTISERYQYVIPMTTTEETRYQDVAQVIVQDYPSKLYIHKVEDGDDKIGDVNGLDGLENVNDQGDLLTYIVRGSKRYLEARGDVENITWDHEVKEYQGTVTKSYDEWSENLVTGTEAWMLSTSNIKPLYDAQTGYFSGYGIQFDIPVIEAVMSLYEGLQVKRTGSNTWDGVTVIREDGKVSSITADKTGSHLEITTNERDTNPPYHSIWDTEEKPNGPVELFFYDLSAVDTEVDELTGELWILDAAGNRICYADALSGMAYTKDDYGNLIAYKAINHQKVLAQSIEVHGSGENEHIYLNLITEDDELGLPLYYVSGEPTYRPERWKTDGTAHEIERLPFGAYILEETEIPYDQGYIKAPDMGLILRESGEEQHFYFQNVFTKLNLAKIDVTTRKEIQDAGMTLYTTTKVPDDSERGYYLEKDQVYASWISGYEYDDNGNLKLDKDGGKIATTEPHWLDHIPVGEYILEETIVPYDRGYVRSESIEIMVTETGNVQTGYMEDDYTQLEIAKWDAYKEEILPGVGLTLYAATLDAEGNPVLDEGGIPVWDEQNLIVSWYTEDGQDVAATAYHMTDYDTGELLYDLVTGEPIIGYAYDYREIPTTLQGRYYITEKGYTHFDYLPVGHYVLVETDTPTGYATADAILVKVQEIGGTVQLQHYDMDDQPLTIDLYKYDDMLVIEGGQQIIGSVQRIYQTDDDGNITIVQARDEHGEPLYETDEDGEWIYDAEGNRIPVMIYNPYDLMYQWTTGEDGYFEAGDEIPEGYQVGDLRPHRIRYIPLGTYALVEWETPYGYLKAEPVIFTIIDTEDIQLAEMWDEIPDGRVVIEKLDEFTGEKLAGATFILKNKTLDEVVEELVTGADGKAYSGLHPIGHTKNGKYESYVYTIQEVDAPDDFMLNPYIHEFRFIYEDDETEVVYHYYEALNQPNQVWISKKLLTALEELPGALLELYQVLIDEVIEYDPWGNEVVREVERLELVESWISGEQPHYIVGLPSGNYRLIETQTPGDGYAIAESIDFTITDNMVEVPTITMFDDHTKVEVHKVKNGSDTLLGGAKFELTDEAGNLIDTFTTSSEEPYVINGLAPGIYYLTEIEAPAGYQKLTSPIKVEVTDTYDVQIFRVENKVKTTGGGGETPKPKTERAYVQKTDGESGTFLSGVLMGIYYQDGREYTRGYTDSQGRLYFEIPAAGDYYFKELEAPEGYYLNPVNQWFSVDADGNVVGSNTLKNYRMKEVPLKKIDGENGDALAGAEFVVYDEAGQAIFTGTTNSEGMMYFLPPAAGNYTFWETKAPKGYQVNSEVYGFTVHPDGTLEGQDTIENLRIQNPLVPKTGDGAGWLIGLSILGLGACAVVVVRLKKKED